MNKLLSAVRWLYQLFDYKEPPLDFNKVDRNTHCDSCTLLFTASDWVIRSHGHTVHATSGCIQLLCTKHNITLRHKWARRYR